MSILEDALVGKRDGRENLLRALYALNPVHLGSHHLANASSLDY